MHGWAGAIPLVKPLTVGSPLVSHHEAEPNGLHNLFARHEAKPSDSPPRTAHER